MDEESRAKRTKALEEKKRRLEELKKRRQAAAAAAVTPKTTSSTSTGTSTGNLDDYIDGLLNNPIPTVPGVSVPPKKEVVPETTFATAEPTVAVATSVAATTFTASVSSTAAPAVASVTPVKKVETFTAGTQTEENDFPPELVDESEKDDKESGNDIMEESSDTNDAETDEQKTPPIQILSPEEKEKAISSDPFGSFFINASKKVERLLGAPVLADLLVDAEYDDRNGMDIDNDIKNQDNGTKSKNKIAESDASYGLVSGRHVYECAKWTQNRDITSMDWSPTHKELIVTGYHMPGATSSINYYDKATSAGAAATRSTGSKSFPKIPSASLVPKPGETQQADGLALVWNLSMTQRPEHIFTCGSPILHTKFHPTESHLLVGGTHSGQLVVWDRRMGRLPVQRSSLSTVANKLKGHSHPICSLEVAEGGSGLVTADTNGKVNFWSLANLRDPAESINLPNSNISALAVAPETNTLLVGDEIGGIQSILPSNMNSAAATSGTSSGRNTSSSGRRTVKRLNGGHEDRNGHFGMITGISTKVLPTRHSHHSATSRSVSRGFLTGSQGLVLTCGVDWSTKLWAPAYKEEPILSFFSHCYDYMADVQWSPTNSAIFATASCKGTLGLWNLANDLDEPMTGPEGIPIEVDMDMSTSSRGGLNKLKWSSDGRRIAVASSDRLHILGMTDEVSKPKPDDETKMINNLTSRGFLDEL